MSATQNGAGRLSRRLTPAAEAEDAGPGELMVEVAAVVLQDSMPEPL